MLRPIVTDCVTAAKYARWRPPIRPPDLGTPYPDIQVGLGMNVRAHTARCADVPRARRHLTPVHADPLHFFTARAASMGAHGEEHVQQVVLKFMLPVSRSWFSQRRRHRQAERTVRRYVARPD